MAWSLEGQTVVTACRDGKARLWDVAAGTERHVWEHDEPLLIAVFNRDGTVVIVNSTLAGSNGLTVSAAGAATSTVTLASGNNYTGGTTLNTGVCGGAS